MENLGHFFFMEYVGHFIPQDGAVTVSGLTD